MADGSWFNEGKNEIGSNGLPSNLYFLLSTRSCPANINAPAAGEHAPGDTLAGGVGEITGTGVTRKTQAEPTPTAGTFTTALLSWANGAATDWQAPKSIVVCTTSDNTGKALCAANINPGGGAFDFSVAGTTLNRTIALLLRALGET